jgi:hypothetical protein
LSNGASPVTSVRSNDAIARAIRCSVTPSSPKAA